MNATHCSPAQSCPAGSRPCLDQLSCHPAGTFCNGHADCHDHSDENCKTNDHVTPGERTSGLLSARPGIVGKQLSGGSGLVPRAFSAPPPATSATVLSEVPGLNTTLDNSTQLLKLGAEECSRRRCSSNGRCVEVNGQPACVCSATYRGDSCQDHVLKTLQGPIGYGVGGLAVAVVITIVIAVVLKKRKSASRGLVSFFLHT